MSGRRAAVVVFFVACAALWAPWWAAHQPREETPAQAAALTLAELSAVPAEAPLSLITEPDQGIAPVAEVIAEASTSLDLVVYELEDPAVERSLAQAQRRGVRVRVMLDNLNSFGRHPNQAAYDFLQKSDVPVRWSPSYFTLTHQKTLVIDGRRALIMTFNLTPQYYATSRDFGIIDDDMQDVAAIEAAFGSDWSGAGAQAPRGRDLLWSPGSAPALLDLIAQASSTLDIYNEEMADPRVMQALEAAAGRGVRVRVVMTYATQWKGALSELARSGAGVRTYASSADFYIHAKAVVADGSRAFLGSENFSAQSLDSNRELGIFLAKPDLLASLEATFASDWARARPYAAPGSSR